MASLLSLNPIASYHEVKLLAGAVEPPCQKSPTSKRPLTAVTLEGAERTFISNLHVLQLLSVDHGSIREVICRGRREISMT